ncbi:MAG: hypothetical protein P4M00_15055 [Azospirillaceae bacterium]|nr:hypothetical protein [Azospirillaceae bacterium]
MSVSPGEFNRLLRAMGQGVNWRAASLCPCRDRNSGAARIDCPVCAGRGVIWAPPVAAWTGITRMRIVREAVAFGAWLSGDEILTIPADSPLYAAAEDDRVVMTDSSEPFSLLLTRGVDDALVFTVVTIDSCGWLAADGQSIVAGSLPMVAGDGSLSWPIGQVGPDAGMQYSLRGRRRPEYFIFKELIRDRAHFGGKALPRRVVARRLDLWGR